MARFVMRKNQRFKKAVPVAYCGEGVTGEGSLKDLSLTGALIVGQVPVTAGMALRLETRMAGEADPLVIDVAIVQWVKKLEFGVEFKPKPQAAKRIQKFVAELVKTKHGSASSRT